MFYAKIPETVRQLRKYIKINILFLVIFSILFSLNLSADEFSPNQGDIFYSWIADLRMRDETGKTIAKLKEYEGVIYLGKHSDKKKTIVLRGQKLVRYNYLVQTNRGITGWVFGGALKQVTGINPSHSETARTCLLMSSHESKPGRLTTNKQRVINGALIRAYLETLELGDLIYKRPIYESGCLGTLEEKCYSNDLVISEQEGGSEKLLYGDFKPILGITKGTSKTVVLEKLGQPRKQNERLFIYQSFYYLKEADYAGSINYYIHMFFDESAKIEVIKIESHYHEDC